MIPTDDPLVNPRPRRSRRRPFGSIKTRPGKPGWYAVFAWRGRTYRRAAGPTRANAEKKLAAAHVALTGGIPIERVLSDIFGDVGVRLTFRDAAPLYLEFAQVRKKTSTFAGDVKRLRILVAAPWAGKMLAYIGADEIGRWAQERVQAGTSGATVNRDLSLASALFKWAERQRYVEENPVRLVTKFSEKGRARETYLTAGESRALIDSASGVLRPILVAALSTGCRRGELLALRWGDVDLDRRELVIRPEVEKAGRGRVVPMTHDLARVLQEMRAARKAPAFDGSDAVFVLADGSPMTVSSLRVMFESTVARCEGIPLSKRDAVTFHTLRHTAASLMVQAGVTLFDVGKVLGHSVLATTARYAHALPAAGRVAIDRLGSALALDGPDLGLKDSSKSQ